MKTENEIIDMMRMRIKLSIEAERRWVHTPIGDALENTRYQIWKELQAQINILEEVLYDGEKQ